MGRPKTNPAVAGAHFSSAPTSQNVLQSWDRADKARNRRAERVKRKPINPPVQKDDESDHDFIYRYNKYLVSIGMSVR